MSTDNVWILGTYMTKFGRHTDKDLIDLASRSEERRVGKEC